MNLGKTTDLGRRTSFQLATCNWQLAPHWFEATLNLLVLSVAFRSGIGISLINPDVVAFFFQVQ